MPYVPYLAYGSNLHPIRLCERVPSARLVGVVEMPGRSVRFHKVSRKDASGKCDLVDWDVASVAYGALYEIDLRHKVELDKAEGLGAGYIQQHVTFELNGRQWNPFLYVAHNKSIDPGCRPYHWYKDFVLCGARYLDFPSSYVQAIEDVQSVDDPDHARSAAERQRLERLQRGFA